MRMMNDSEFWRSESVQLVQYFQNDSYQCASGAEQVGGG